MEALVIDDSAMMRRLLCRMLAECGFEAREADNGVAGLEALSEGPPPRLVLLDWNMPEMSGIEVVGRIRSEARYDQTRLMMVTTETDMTKMVEALSDGADEYLMKPFTRSAFEEKLRILGFELGKPENTGGR